MNRTTHNPRNPNYRVASTVVFVPGTDLEKAKRWLKEAKKRGIIVSHDTQDYDSSFGGPVLYFP